jgi:hypothetical protein
MRETKIGIDEASNAGESYGYLRVAVVVFGLLSEIHL